MRFEAKLAPTAPPQRFCRDLRWARHVERAARVTACRTQATRRTSKSGFMKANAARGVGRVLACHQRTYPPRGAKSASLRTMTVHQCEPSSPPRCTSVRSKCPSRKQTQWSANVIGHMVASSRSPMRSSSGRRNAKQCEVDWPDCR